MGKRFWALFGIGAALAVVLGAGAALLVTGGADGEREYRSPSDLPADVVAFVSRAPSDVSIVTVSALERALRQTAAQQGIQRAPMPGDRRYKELHDMALNGILEMIWLEGQASEMGISISATEVEDEKQAIRKDNFKTASQYEKFLRESHFSAADIDRRVHAQVLSGKVQGRLTAAGEELDDAFVRDFNMKWRTRTICAPAHATEKCVNSAQPAQSG